MPTMATLLLSLPITLKYAFSLSCSSVEAPASDRLPRKSPSHRGAAVGKEMQLRSAAIFDLASRSRAPTLKLCGLAARGDLKASRRFVVRCVA